MRFKTNPRFGLTFRRRTEKDIELGRTSAHVAKRLTGAIAGTLFANVVDDCNVYAVSGWNAPSRTCAIPVAAGEIGCEGSQRSTSGTCRQPWHTTWVASCVRCSERENRDTRRSLPRGFILSISPLSSSVTNSRASGRLLDRITHKTHLPGSRRASDDSEQCRSIQFLNFNTLLGPKNPDQTPLRW